MEVPGLAVVVRAVLVLLAVGGAPLALAGVVPSSTGGSSWVWENRLPQGNSLLGIDCPKGSTTCVAVGRVPGSVRFDGANWYGVRMPGASDEWIAAVSCPTSTQCFAVGSNNVTNTGVIRAFNGTSWTQVTPPSGTPPLRWVSCPSTTTCYALNDYGSLLTYNGVSWSLSKPLAYAGSQYSIMDLSCSSATSCVATTRPYGGVANRYYLTFNGTSWVENVLPSSLPLPDKVSCVSGTECYAIGATVSSPLLRFNGSTWSLGASFPNSSGLLASLSCPSTGRCVAVGYTYNNTTYQQDNQVYSYNGTSWTNISPVVSQEGLVKAVSCSSGTSCYAVTDDGAIISIDGTSSRYVHKTLTPATILKVDCPSSTLCFAITSNGEVLRYNGTSWSIAYSVNVANSLRGISCPSTSRCFAVGTYSVRNGFVLSFDGTSWSAMSQPYDFSDISCATTTSCQALTGNDIIVQYDGVNWTPFVQPVHSSMSHVSCPAPNVCYAVTFNGKVASFDGSTWTYGTMTSSMGLPRLEDIDCLNTSECFAVGSGFAGDGPVIMRLSGGVWSEVLLLSSVKSSAYLGVDCSRDGGRCVVVGHDTRVFTGSTWNRGDAGTAPKRLSAVSCPISSRCFAVGSGGAIIRYQ